MSKVEKDKLEAFLNDIDETQKKHNLRLVPVLMSNAYSIHAQFNVEELEKKPETDGSADKGDKEAEE